MQVGIPCAVFEQDLSLDQRTRDWDFGIYWAQTPLEECLPRDVRDKLLTAQVDRVQPHADAFIPGLHAETGEEIQRIATPYYLRMRRRELSRVMGKDLDIRVRPGPPPRPSLTVRICIGYFFFILFSHSLLLR